MNDFDFQLVWKDPPRTTTREQWKSARRWLRLCRREVRERLDIDFEKLALDAMLYGTGMLRIG